MTNMEIAERIADELFRSGSGRSGTRLLIWDDKRNMDLGGYSKESILRHIVKILDKASGEEAIRDEIRSELCSEGHGR